MYLEGHFNSSSNLLKNSHANVKSSMGLLIYLSEYVYTYAVHSVYSKRTLYRTFNLSSTKLEKLVVDFILLWNFSPSFKYKMLPSISRYGFQK